MKKGKEEWRKIT